jgi:hypothetical protein
VVAGVANTFSAVLNTSSTNQISDTNVNNDSSLLVDTDVTDIDNLNILSLNCCGVKLRLQYLKFVVNVETVSDKYNMFSLPFRFFLNRI